MNLFESLTLQDYNNELAQLRAGKSSKSKLLLAKFKSEKSLEGWEVRQGTYFQDVVAAKYDGGMNAKFEFTESGDTVFSGDFLILLRFSLGLLCLYLVSYAVNFGIFVHHQTK